MITGISDEEIINGILENDDTMINYIYKTYYGKIKSLVHAFRNLSLDPDDIFQEGVIRVIMNIRRGKFEGRSSFFTYLNGICRNVCLKELKKLNTTDYYEQPYQKEEETNLNFEMIGLIMRIREGLDDKCRKIIDLRFGLPGNYSNAEEPDHKKNMPFEEIANSLNIQPANARQRFKRCLEKLHGLVTKAPEYHELVTA